MTTADSNWQITSKNKKAPGDENDLCQRHSGSHVRNLVYNLKKLTILLKCLQELVIRTYFKNSSTYLTELSVASN